MKHIIRTQVLELNIDQQLDAFDIQHRMSMLYHNELLPALEKLFNALSDGDHDIIIDKLELDLGPITEKSFADRTCIQQWISGMEEQLQQITRIQPGQPSAAQVIRRPRSRSVFRQWLYYMQRGYLPWNATTPDQLWHEQVLESAATDYHCAEELRQLISSNPVAAERIAIQHDETFLVHLAEILTAKKQEQLSTYLQEIATAIHSATHQTIQVFTSLNTTQISRRLWKTVLRSLSGSTAGSATPQDTAIYTISEYFKPATAAQLLKNKDITVKLPQSLPLFKKLAETSEAKKASDKPTPPPSSKKEPPAAAASSQKLSTQKENSPEIPEVRITISHNDQEKPVIGSALNTEPAPLAAQITEEGIFVQHAGIVLLSPFIKPFFNNLGLLTNAKFTDDNSALKAICLLHYLATGLHSGAEHELVIPKLLCGIPLSACIDNHITLSETETNEAEELLAEAIAQWEILKKTSNAGLRETFLQRPGKLITRNDRPHLQVEAGPIDMLLDYLPWNISIIKLPWMKEYLQVEWR